MWMTYFNVKTGEFRRKVTSLYPWYIYLVDVRDDFSLSWHVDFLIVCSHLTLNGEEQNLQISLFGESVKHIQD